MLGPKTENSVDTGDHNTLIGHNTGTISVGLTFADHQAALEKALGDRERLLERAHSAERAVLQAEVDALKAKLANLDADFQDRIAELTSLKQILSRFDNQIDMQKREAAFAAIDRGDTALARALLTELAAKATSRFCVFI